MAQAVIEAHDLQKVYAAGVDVAALRGVSFSVEPATFLAIMGPSGSGKSTLLSILGALEIPTRGRVVLEGTDIGSLSDDARTLLRRRRIGFVFQQFNLLPLCTAVENVALPLRLEGVGASEANRRALKQLDLVGMSPRADHLPSQLSGGEQQRVAIARALVAEPAIVLADEPTGALDTSAGDNVIGILRKLVSEQGQTVVMVTHDLSVAQRADRIIQVRDGQIYADIDQRDTAAAAVQATEHSA